MINLKADFTWNFLMNSRNLMNILHKLINKRSNSRIKRLLLKCKPLYSPISIDKLNFPGICKKQVYKFFQLIIKLSPDRKNLHIFMSIILLPFEDSILWFWTFCTT